ncbi:MAG: hypothetical protein A3C43_06555 [Candidatus Schekmanbacteria bacterium RIFCSPHIGHO2_02_FULL_38_11]|uniref:Sulfotransferase domain-containing protein n=1 Tax=Candidatus Schekmanbacteria bacterium RIFCSPLOWO2_12_FULL_38_15 TaxID=1817883 RepID=A0A1F7SDN2_9BACT|nr:MAG: hypothetical protein A2043_07605 [Candidatus Schekmanbacteria bacterium GWA2_38_9]OGL49577.1 MAG: hypothetical protein A3C43_06555 [Candidatus Schekmanbacteria bacterium RIFCSPHIGHO2_02_FULL_38_11]OGL51481.1 MAG: hypothetical protein A3H37_12270 [Candidatus Schekmanbacteria bacterium RIFCSPLOWO2_02_FULL_38_14]OGL51831.1 MAG: hypothetical protein A3G31_12675 [Candidatus Schekmanbacteria bacterium RIFCSPLOWO2_12_FULL_38_15]
MNPGKTIIIAGSGRSGTTWLAEVIASCKGFRLFFEPFNNQRSVRYPENDLLLYAYMRPDSHYPKVERFICDVLKGKIRNRWIDSHNINLFTWRYVLKEIRIVLMLGWIKEKYGNKIVYTTRHPCATVLSRLKEKWTSPLNVIWSQQELVEDYLSPYESIIRGAKTEIEKHAVMWCVENLIPLKQMGKYNYFFTTYEAMCIEPEKEIDRIFSYLRLRRTKRVTKAIQLTPEARPHSAVITGEDKISFWKNRLSGDEIKSIMDIVNLFEIDIYSTEPMPHKFVNRSIN